MKTRSKLPAKRSLATGLAASSLTLLLAGCATAVSAPDKEPDKAPTAQTTPPPATSVPVAPSVTARSAVAASAAAPTAAAAGACRAPRA